MPEQLLVRETAAGGWILVTAPTDARQASAVDIAALHDRRRQAELDLRLSHHADEKGFRVVPRDLASMSGPDPRSSSYPDVQ